jgi:hypothetical protein
MNTQKLIEKVADILRDSGQFETVGLMCDEQPPFRVFMTTPEGEFCWITIPEQNPVIALLLDLEDKTAVLSYHDEEHPILKRIVELGEDAIGPLIKHLKHRQSWYAVLALSKITGEWPVPSDHAGKLDEIVNDWLTWSKENFYTL